MISLAILSVALVAIADVNGTAVKMHAYAKSSMIATFLARSKMEDLEEKLQKDGFSDFDDRVDGNFDDEGWPEYRWSAAILKPEISLDAGQLMSMVGGATGLDLSSLSGGGASSSAASSSSSAGGATGALGGLGGPFAGLIQSQLKSFIEEMKNSVREVHLTIYWKAGGEEDKLEVATHVVILPGMVNKTSAPGAAPGATPGAIQGLPPGVAMPNQFNTFQPPRGPTHEEDPWE